MSLFLHFMQFKCVMSFHRHEWVMSHEYYCVTDSETLVRHVLIHGRDVTVWCATYMTHGWMWRDVWYDTCLKYEWVMFRIWKSHVPHINWVMSHVYMRHVIQYWVKWWTTGDTYCLYYCLFIHLVSISKRSSHKSVFYAFFGGILIRHVSYEWVMLCMSESCHILMSHMTY